MNFKKSNNFQKKPFMSQNLGERPAKQKVKQL